MDVEKDLEVITGKYLATQALSHVLLNTLTRTNPELAQDLLKELEAVYNVLPARLSGLPLESFNQEWEEIHRLISRRVG